MLYPYAGEYAKPKHLDVLCRHTEVVPVPAGRYEFTVTGPNGFRREFAGDGGDVVAVESTIDPRRRRLTLRLVNRGDRAVTFAVGSRRATVRAGGARTWSTGTDHGWYDVTVTAGSFRRLLAGHIEDGEESVTD